MATLDLIRSLLATVRRGRITLVLTYRTDEVDHHHPLRQFQVELGRVREVIRVELGRLTPDEVGRLVRELRGDELPHGALEEIVERSGGVPFFVEELVGLEPVGDGSDRSAPHLPEVLRDLLLSRYERLAESTQAVLRLLSAGGVSVSHELLELVHDGDPEALETAVREAVEGRVLAAGETAYTFRHALTQEAVAGELLPGERVRFHARYAVALAGRPDLAGSSAELARHHLAAHDLPRALEATVAAAGEAARSAAPLMAARLGEQALELWPKVPDAAAVVGCSRPELFLRTTQAYYEAGDPRAVRIVQEGIADCPPEDRRHRALLLHEGMVVLVTFSVPGGLKLVREAVEVAPDGPDEQDRAVRVRVRVGLGIILVGAGRAAEGRSVLEEAVVEARALRAEATDPQVRAQAGFELARALVNLGSAYGGAGDLDAALEVMDEALGIDGAGPVARLRDAEQRGGLLGAVGRHAACVEACLAGLEVAREIGQERGWGPALLLTAVPSMLALGRLAEAERSLDRVDRLGPSGSTETTGILLRSELLLHLDQVEQAGDLLQDRRELLDYVAERDEDERFVVAAARARLALAQGDPETAWETASAVLAADLPPPGTVELGPVAAAALAEAGRAGTRPAVELVDLADQLREVWARVPERGVVPLLRTVIEAELSGLAGRKDARGAGDDGGRGAGDDGGRGDGEVAAWEAAVTAAATGRIGVAAHAHCLTRLARARLDAGDRAGAASALAAAADVADGAGLRRAGRLVAELSAQAGLEPPLGTRAGVGGAAGVGVVLTGRERQVLELVAAGLTNRQIGDRLFISDKTASVHVSAILRKLGVASRTEAAVLAGSLLGEPAG